MNNPIESKTNDKQLLTSVPIVLQEIGLTLLSTNVSIVLQNVGLTTQCS